MKDTVLDSYLVEAAVNKWVVVDKGAGGRFTYVTVEGKTEINNILTKVAEIIDSTSQKDITTACESLKKEIGKDFTPNQLLSMILTQMVGTEVRLLAFLMGERDANYKYLLSTMKEVYSPKTNLSVVQKKPYDS